MGSVFRKTITRPVPATAEVVTIQGKKPRRIARWQSGGRRVDAEVTTTTDGRDMVRVKSSTYYAKYRNADDNVVVVPTGCRDRKMAEQFLARLEKEAERVHAGVATQAETQRAKRMGVPSRPTLTPS
jgi:hypothetical protein